MKFVLIMTFILPSIALCSNNNIFKDLTSIEKPFNLRDPFQPPTFKVKKKSKTKITKNDGVYDNVPTIGKAKIEDIRITGVLIGKERRATAIVTSKPDITYIIREGDKLGKSKSKVRAILPGGLILVDKITNIYEQEEYIETVIPISK